VVRDHAGNLYGTTTIGGGSQRGVVYMLSKTGVEKSFTPLIFITTSTLRPASPAMPQAIFTEPHVVASMTQD
jgi:uncharacterized repeat protein (TIGR03803 family)